MAIFEKRPRHFRSCPRIFPKNALWRTVHLKVLKSEIFMDKKSFTGEKKKSPGRCHKLLRCRKVGNGLFLRRRLVSTSFLPMVPNVQLNAQELENKSSKPHITLFWLKLAEYQNRIVV